jgi:hypothetical protein
MDEQAKAAFASASDTSKQLITLATGLLALEITFGKDFIGKFDTVSKGLVGASWVLLLLSVVAGIWTLMALTGSLGQVKDRPTAESVYSWNVRIPSITQVLFFVGGLAFTVWFGLRGASL